MRDGADAQQVGGPPPGHTFDPNASHAAEPSPFLFKLLVCFMALAGLEAAIELGVWAASRPAVTTISYDPFAPNVPFTILWAGVHFVLAGLLLVRAAWGRVWTQAILALHIFYLVQEIAFVRPDIWVYLTGPGRARLLLTLAIDLTAILWLTTPSARRALSR